jgi:leucyl aminopeptidase
MTAIVALARTIPKTANAVGVPVATSGAVPRSLGLNRAALAAHGFEGKIGQVLVIPTASGPTQVAVGVGDPSVLTVQTVRTAVAAVVRAASLRHVASSMSCEPIAATCSTSSRGSVLSCGTAAINASTEKAAAL